MAVHAVAVSAGGCVVYCWINFVWEDWELMAEVEVF